MRNHSSSTGLLNRSATPFQTEPAEAITVPALSYTQLRLLAECTAGIDNTAAHFIFASQGLTRTQSNVAPATAVLVPARQKGRFSRLVQVGLQRILAIAQDGAEIELETLNAVDYFADAVFWSDSAVKKFLFPYVASCRGSGAGNVLRRLEQAWNGYPGAVTVYALMHVVPSRFDTPLDLGSAIWVVFADADGVLRAQSLDVFLPETSLPDGGYPVLTGTTNALQVPYDRGSMEAVQPQSPDYITLRAMAEYAASLTSQPYYFVFRAGEKTFDTPVTELPTDLQPGDFVIPVQTPTVPAVRPELGALWFQPQGQYPMDLGHAGDAMFWSTGAIEQFMFPYYASKLGFAAPEDLAAMRKAWDPTFVPPSPEALGEGQESAREKAGTETSLTGETEVYALVHLPRSDWVSGDQAEGQVEATLSDEQRDVLHRARTNRRTHPFSALHEVGVVHRGRTGAVNVLPLARFKALYPHHFA